ncbi:hypothetical protein [Streptomyces sp. NPDC056987]
MSASCGHPDKLVTYNKSGADGRSYQAVRHEACTCGQRPAAQQSSGRR